MRLLRWLLWARLLLLLLWALALVVLASVACEPLPTVAPSPVHVVNTPQKATPDICEAIRSGRLKPLVPVPGC
jgi:photosystem II stability/assembly factor-like uncharacterized protein